MQRQNALGTPHIHRTPSYQQTKMGRVVGTKNYKKFGKIEVVFLDYGAPMPVWVIGDVDREPVEGDMVVIGYMEGRKDTPYLAGFVRNKAYTSNSIVIEKDRIRLQLPASEADRKEGMVDDGKKSQRPYIEVDKSGAISVNGTSFKFNGRTVQVL